MQLIIGNQNHRPLNFREYKTKVKILEGELVRVIECLEETTRNSEALIKSYNELEALYQGLEKKYIEMVAGKMKAVVDAR